MEELKVIVDYKNGNQEIKKSYNFKEYVNICSSDLKKLLNEIESSFVRLKGCEKEEWDDVTLKEFNFIRKKILNTANSVSRLPVTLTFDEIPVSEFIADIVDNI